MEEAEVAEEGTMVEEEVTRVATVEEGKEGPAMPLQVPRTSMSAAMWVTATWPCSSRV